MKNSQFLIFLGSIQSLRDFFNKIEMDSFFFMSFISKGISYVKLKWAILSWGGMIGTL